MLPEQYKANEKYFLQMLMSRVMFYTWKDKCNTYDMSSGKMKPLTLKGYVELSEIVRRPFMNMFVILPEGHDYNKVWETIHAVEWVFYFKTFEKIKLIGFKYL